MSDLQTRSLTTTAGQVMVTHMLISHTHGQPRPLLLMLPGMGYTCAHPALHYLQMSALYAGYDVLAARYSFQAAPERTSFDAVGWEGVHSEVAQIIAAAAQAGYTDNIVLAGKSLGTPPAVQQAHALGQACRGLILQTPIRQCVAEVRAHRTLALIGTADERYNPAEIAADAARRHVSWCVYEGVNHALEVDGDTAASIAVLGRVIADCEAFLRRLL